MKLSGIIQNIKFDTLEEIIDSMNRESIFLTFDEDLRSILEICDLFNRVTFTGPMHLMNYGRQEAQAQRQVRNWDLEFD